MKQILYLSLSLIFLSGCVALKTNNPRASWMEKLNGKIKSIKEASYKAPQSADPKNPFKSVTSPKDFTPRDSTVTSYNQEQLPIENLFYCKQYDENEDLTFGLCFKSSFEFDKNGRLKKSLNHSLDSDEKTTFKYKAYNELQLPVFIEEINSEGKVICNHVLEFNKKGKLKNTRIVYKEEKETVSETHLTFEYNRKGHLIKMTIETRDAKGFIEDEPIVHQYEYFEFDKEGNWTKRKEMISIDEDQVFLAFRAYEYYE